MGDQLSVIRNGKMYSETTAIGKYLIGSEINSLKEDVGKVVDNAVQYTI